MYSCIITFFKNRSSWEFQVSFLNILNINKFYFANLWGKKSKGENSVLYTYEICSQILTRLMGKPLTCLKKEEFGFFCQSRTARCSEACCDFFDWYAVTICAIHSTRWSVRQNTEDQAVEPSVVLPGIFLADSHDFLTGSIPTYLNIKLQVVAKHIF